MALCEDCIHEKLCVIKAFPDAFENTEWSKKPCDHFKPTTDFVPRSEVHDDHHKQVACYTLGCREGDKIKREVAREIFDWIERSMVIYNPEIPGLRSISMNVFNALKKKYTEENK